MKDGVFVRNVYMKMAEELSQLSKCVSQQVACLIVKDGRVISTGVNGTPPGYMNCNDIFVNKLDEISKPVHREWSDKYELHAEQNAIVRAAKEGYSINDTDVYCTLKPCHQCTKLLIAVGARNIFYRNIYDKYNESENIKTDEYLNKNGVTICHLPSPKCQ